MRTFLFFLLFTSLLNAQNGISLTFSEIMFDTPTADNSDFVEIYNTSSTVSVDLSTIKIYYDGSNKPFTEYNGGGYILAPGQYALIFENDLDIDAGVYSGKIDPGALILLRTASTWNLVNSNKFMEIRNDADEVLDTYTYSASNKRNYSDEKINMTKVNTADNWENSNREYGTPGGTNSVTPLQYDLEFKEYIFNPNPVFDGGNLEIAVKVLNSGTSNAVAFAVNIYEDLNGNGIADELLKTEDILNLDSGDSVIVSVTKNNVSESTLNFIAEIVFAQDQNTLNNKKLESIAVFPPRRDFNDIVINEIMYDPDTENDQPEWIELYNTSNDDINIKGWEISDPKDSIVISNVDLTIPSKNYFVLIDDTDLNTKYAITSGSLVVHLPSLNNTGDEITLKDYADKIIDNVNYQSSWGNADEYSLERIEALGSSNDAANWGVSIAGNGATPGSINTLSPKQFDVEVSSIVTTPQYIIDGNDATIDVTTKNRGQQAANAVNVIIYNDINNNNIGDAGEELFNQNYGPLVPNDSVISTVVMNALRIGVYQVIAKAVFVGDEFTGNNNKIKTFRVIPTPSAINDIVINEIMYDPNSGEPEWIEIYNRTNSAINLKNWKIADASSSVVISNNDYNLGANEYLVLSDDASISSIFSIPSNVLVVAVPSLNNGGDNVVLLDSLERVIDSLYYSSNWGDDAISAERKRVDIASTLSSNWGQSVDAVGGTPGKENSIETKQFDLTFSSFTISPQVIYTPDSPYINAIIKNVGYNVAGNFEVIIYHDKNKNGIGDVGEEINTKNINNLNLGDSVSIIHNLGTLSSGSYNYIGEIVFGNDQRLTNNKAQKTISVNFAACSYNDIVINEIMYKPNRGDPEWIELYNRSSNDIDLRRFSLGSTHPSVVVSNSQFILPSKGYVVISENNNLGEGYTVGSEIIVVDLFSLNNSADEIVLYDENDREIDNVSYTSEMGGNESGISLERKSAVYSSIFKSNWNSSEAVEGATPGYLNSTVPLDYDLKIRNAGIISTSIVAGEELTLEYSIVNESNKISNRYSVNIYNDLNFDGLFDKSEQIYTQIYSPLNRQSQDKKEFKSIENNAGNYQYIIELITNDDPRLNNNIAVVNFSVLPKPATRGDIVISEFMYAPTTGKPEWIELYNTTGYDIQLFNWQIGDNSNTVILPAFTISSGGFIIISDKVERTYSLRSEEGQSNIIYVDLPSLNNKGDVIKLFDAYNTSIDLVEYSSSWGGENGHSLERLELGGNSNDSENWLSSKNVGGSAGKKNSIIPEEYDLELTRLNVVQKSPFEKNDVQLSVTIKNIGIYLAENFVVEIILQKEGGDKAVIESKTYSSLAIEDSINLQLKHYIKDFGSYQITSEIIYLADNNLSNNTYQRMVEVLKTPKQFGDCVINEIMYNPRSGEAEWIEIYNLTSEEINLSQWKIGDKTSSVTIDKSVALPSNNYLVIASDTVGLQKYGITNFFILNLPALNNSGDEVKLYNQYSMIIDSLQYEGSWGGKEKSLERRDRFTNANISSNWRPCSFEIGGTPGLENSIVVKDYDLAITGIKYLQGTDSPNGKGTIEAKIYNDGKLKSTVYGIEFFNDKNLNNLPNEGERIYVNNLPGLEPNDTTIIRFNYKPQNTGLLKILGRINFSDDERIDNNLFGSAYSISELPNNFNDLVINEIMYDPLTGNSEWIEIINLKNDSINLKGWSISDLTRSQVITDKDNWIHPNEYFVLSNSESILNEFEVDSKLIITMHLPSLNNSGDQITIKDRSNIIIDEIKYSNNWGGGGGKSLERIDLYKSTQDSTNWQTSYAAKFATPGKINSKPELLPDLELSSIALSSKNIKSTDTLVVVCTIKNIGAKNSKVGKVNYKIINGETEILDTIELNSIITGDSLKLTNLFSNLPPGECSLEITVDGEEDSNINNNTAKTSFYVSATQYVWGNVKINEIMYDPDNNEPEWIELVNTSDNTASLIGWTINDNSSTVGKIDTTISIEPNEYIILADEAGLENIYPIESKIVVLNLPSLNNTGDLIKISDAGSVVIDTVSYKSSWGGKDGKSLERIFLDQASANENNWSTSLSLNGATPGQINSIAGGWIDVVITSFSASDDFTILPAKSEFEIKIENVGITNSSDGTLYLYTDMNNDSIYTKNELLDSVIVKAIQAGEEKSLTITTSIQSAGNNKIIAKINFDKDINVENNVASTYHKVIKINEVRGDLVLNEIMYSPKSGESEWIELYNNSNKIIDLNGYQVQDSRSGNIVVNGNILLQPNEYFVVANDSSIYKEFDVKSKSVVSKFPSLNNSGDVIVILDSLSRVIDSLQFTSDWGGANGVSIEKLSPGLDPLKIDSWRTANKDLRGTPGSVNSITTGWIDLEITDLYTNAEYTLFPNKIIGFVEIKNNGISTAEKSKLYFYNDLNNDSTASINELIDSLQLNKLNGSGLAQVEFSVNNKQIGPIKLIAVLVNDKDSKTANNKIYFSHRVINPVEEKMDLVINEFMNNPLEGYSEWIELYNKSANIINLYGYKISDNRSSVTVYDDEIIIGPNSYLIIANDSSFIHEFNYQQNVLVMDFPSLNNTGDDIVITNILGTTVDSVQYTSDWIGEKGKSIERANLTGSSSDKGNWNISISNLSGTPGSANSYAQRDFDASITNVSFKPEYPKAGDIINLSVTVKNTGKKDVEEFSVKVFTGDTEIENIQVPALKTNDSLIVKNSKTIILEKETEYLFAINSAQDEAGYNDSLRVKIIPSYSRGAVVISEFMYNPFNNEPEWVEIVNNSANEIDLSQWSISDLLSKPSIKVMAHKSTIIKPNEFVVVASDSNVHGIKKETKLLVTKFGSLGNSGDGILIYDKTGSVIDSVKYESNWSELKGQSVERVKLNNSSNVRSNWIQSISVDNATPGYANSIWEINPSKSQSLVINEIMANPNDDNSEFVEVYNRSEDYIDIGGWTLTDNSGKRVRLSEYSHVLSPNDYFVFLTDSSALYNYDWLNDEGKFQIANSSFALTNSGEQLILQDLWGIVIDSLIYDDGWNNKNISFTKNKSLERINPHINSNYSANWSTCVDNLGASPGKENSIYTEHLSNETKLSVSPNPFSPDADGFEDNTIISYNLTQAIAQVRIRVFDSKGRHVRTIESNKASGSKGEIIFNGFDDNCKPLRIGIYILLVEALNSNNGVVETMKKAIVIARKI